MQKRKQVQHQKETEKRTSKPPQRETETKTAPPTQLDALLQRAEADPDGLSAADAHQLQHTIGNQAVGRLNGAQPSASPDAAGLSPVNRKQQTDASLAPILNNVRRISQSITPHTQPVIHRKIHDRYVRQWADAVQDGYLSGEEVDQLRHMVAPLKGKSDSKLKDVISLSNLFTKLFKNKSKKRKIQALLWQKVLEVGPDNIGALNLYKSELKEKSPEEINGLLGIIENVEEAPQLLAPPDNVDFDDPPWETANGVTVKDSGHGGVVIVDFPNGKLVVKAAKGGGLQNEVFGGRLAQHLGMASPDMRFAGDVEAGRIETAVAENDGRLPAGRPYVVMKYVPGVTGGEFAQSGQELSRGEVNTLAMSIGRWFAFDIMIQEQDRFNILAAQGTGVGVNSANFMINPDDVGSGFVSIDQNVSSSGGEKSESAFQNIAENSFMFAYQLGRTAADMLPGNVDEEEVGDIVMQSARETLRDIGQGLTEDDVRGLAAGLGIREDVIESIMRTVNAAREQFN